MVDEDAKNRMLINALEERLQQIDRRLARNRAWLVLLVLLDVAAVGFIAFSFARGTLFLPATIRAKALLLEAPDGKVSISLDPTGFSAGVSVDNREAKTYALFGLEEGKHPGIVFHSGDAHPPFTVWARDGRVYLAIADQSGKTFFEINGDGEVICPSCGWRKPPSADGDPPPQKKP
jgi:hypothetical protein